MPIFFYFRGKMFRENKGAVVMEPCLEQRPKYDKESHPLFVSIVQRLYIHKPTTLKDLKQLKDDILEVSEDAMKYNGRMKYEFLPRPFHEDIELVSEWIRDLSPEWFRLPIQFDPTVRGYLMPPYSNELNILYEDFQLWSKYFLESPMEKPTFEEFRDWFTNNTCTEWAKMNRYGNFYSGPWSAEEGSYERENAWQLCIEDNCKALYELIDDGMPFKFIKETIKIGCGNRQESVPYTVMLCEWMRRKIEQMPQN
jgi:hypothetical protein